MLLEHAEEPDLLFGFAVGVDDGFFDEFDSGRPGPTLSA